jgi:hypothetical protein
MEIRSGDFSTHLEAAFHAEPVIGQEKDAVRLRV